MWQASEITKETRWSPFQVRAGKSEAIRGLTALDGVADRLRLVCFAELQARDAFRYGAARFAETAPKAWIEDWLRFAAVEERHAQMLLDRMAELGVEHGAKAVSDKLTALCEAAPDALTFLFLLSSAEERGMEAGSILGKQMQSVDPVSAAVFAQIAEEEVEHVAMAKAALKDHEEEALRVRARAVNAVVDPR